MPWTRGSGGGSRLIRSPYPLQRLFAVVRECAAVPEKNEPETSLRLKLFWL